ncbi:MAG: sensor histidine kinase, partial [Bryobacteraceae bacterium]
RPAAESKGLEFRLETPGVALPVLGDTAWLRRLALLLIDNAIKFTPPGGSVHVRLQPQGEAYLLEVADTGCGIEPRDLPHIFDRFFQADPSRSTGGAGLGLSIARWIVESHHGRIEAISEPGRGATFRVSLPAAEARR